MSAQGFFGRLRALVNRAVYAIRHGLTGRAFGDTVRAVDPSVDRNELRRVRREATIGIETATRAATLQASDPLSAALGPRLRPREPGGAFATTVQVWMRYPLEHPTRGEIWREMVVGTGVPGDPVMTWDTTIAEVRARVEEQESLREPMCGSGPIDWSQAEFVAPLRYPHSP